MNPRLESVWFGPGSQYSRLARVLDMTARRHCPGWDINVQQLLPCTLRAASGSTSAAANHYKLQHWATAVQQAPDGAQLLLVDADVFIVASLDPLWDHAFDIAYTERTGSRFPLNAGVVACRVGDGVRRWFAAWLARDLHFLHHIDAGRHWRSEYGGFNQASLGALLEACTAESLGLVVAALPCLEWNAEDTSWQDFGPGTRIVHVKSALRMDAFDMSRSPRTRELARLWRELDAEAQATAPRSGPAQRPEQPVVA